jgi:hypothetical protein
MRAQTQLLVTSILMLGLSIAGAESQVRGQDPMPFRTVAEDPVSTPYDPGPITLASQPPVPYQVPGGPPGASPYAPPSGIIEPAPPGTFAAPPLGAPAPPCGAYPAPGGCLPGGACGNPCCPQLQFIADVEFTMFYSSVHGVNDAASVPNVAGDPKMSLGTSDDDLYREFAYAPRISAGVQYDGWAVLGRFWYLSDWTNSLTAPGSNATFSDDQLKAYTADIELDRTFLLWGSKIDLFVGARYASFSAGQSVDVGSDLVSGVGPVSYASALSQFSFNGWGVTTGFEGHTPIAGTELNILWGFRASVLWGEAERRALAAASLVDAGGGAVDADGDVEKNGAVAYILEPELGLEWRHELRWLPMSTYLKVAFEYQYWNLGGDGSLTKTASAAVPAAAPATATASIEDVNANFIGLTIGAGLNW